MAHAGAPTEPVPQGAVEFGTLSRDGDAVNRDEETTEQEPEIEFGHAPTGAVAELSIDRELCQGHGRCYSLAPELFDCDDDGDGHVIRQWLSAADIASARTAMMSCPERAIFVRDVSVSELSRTAVDKEEKS